jgi:hypothetical protein
VTSISYGGDEAGIVCKLDLGNAYENAAFVSITLSCCRFGGHAV